MEKVSKIKKSLWMRRVDFTKIRDALQFVSEHNGQLRAKDLEKLGIDKGFFRRKNGQPFSRTTMPSLIRHQQSESAAMVS